MLLGIGAVFCSFQIVVRSNASLETRTRRLGEIFNIPRAIDQGSEDTSESISPVSDPFPAFVPLLNRTVETPVPVVVYPYSITGVATEQAFQLAVDGIRQSPYMSLEKNIHNFDPNVVWVVDESDGGSPRQTWCANLEKVVREAKAERARLGLPTTWPIHFLQVFHDTPQMFRCVPVVMLVGKQNVKYFKRSIVRNRAWNEEMNYIEPGSISLEKQTQHTPIAVRTDIVHGVQDYLKEQNLDLTYPYEQLDRPIDVVHYWPEAPTKKVLAKHGRLRFLISGELKKIGRENDMSTFVGLAGEGREKGRSEANPSYLAGMMKSKIHVVSAKSNCAKCISL